MLRKKSTSAPGLQRDRIRHRQPDLEFGLRRIGDLEQPLADRHRPADPGVGIVVDRKTAAGRGDLDAIEQRLVVGDVGAALLRAALQHRQLARLLSSNTACCAAWRYSASATASALVATSSLFSMARGSSVSSSWPALTGALGCDVEVIDHAFERRADDGRLQRHHLGRRQRRQGHRQAHDRDHGGGERKLDETAAAPNSWRRAIGGGGRETAARHERSRRRVRTSDGRRRRSRAGRAPASSAPSAGSPSIRSGTSRPWAGSHSAHSSPSAPSKLSAPTGRDAIRLGVAVELRERRIEPERERRIALDHAPRRTSRPPCRAPRALRCHSAACR